jgi:hypothetical protein
MGALHHTMKNMHRHEMEQIIIYLNKQFSRVLFPYENQGVTAYNQNVREKSFQVGDFVWKTILLLGTQKSWFRQVLSELGRSL